ncbi:DOT1-domain-containing protein [Hesseltinella vesiculosa]|uniref:Histone-lysine N-methyltransferase, H3 lysine-79 specific n=1 Tax=Hesseltinella vesiculosa TaxID=101127 RepID=A0A1X2GQU5_9FUNG|nr:DOT1-domain-containing protein [Hesseltinella vesiculosa]
MANVAGMKRKIPSNEQQEIISRKKTPGKESKVRSMLSSANVVQTYPSLYRSFFTKDPSEWKDDASLRIELEYPAHQKEEFFLVCPITQETQQYNPMADIADTIQHIYDDYLTREQQKRFGDVQQGIMRQLTKYRNRREQPGYVAAIDQWNTQLRDLKQQHGALSLQETRRRHASYTLACHVLYQIYSRTVAFHADKLNRYKAFSNFVYGEVNPSFVNEMIERTKMTVKSVFVDLGSGIGNAVLQVAAQTGCESFGIEIMETPCKLAKRQLKEYATRMKAWGLATGKVHFRQGDFLDGGQQDLMATMRRADVVLVNNYAFDSTTNQDLLRLFLDLKEGAKIVSLKSFVHKNHKINARNFHLPESILQVQELPYYSDAVSWSHQDGTFFISTVNRQRLAQYT